MRIVRWIDANIERVVILVAYVTMAAIIFVEVIRRFLFSEQAAWSTTIPIYMFLWIVWIACAYNVRIRAHLSFDEVRAKLPRTGQFLCLMLDSVLWIIFSVIVIDRVIEIPEVSELLPLIDESGDAAFFDAVPVSVIDRAVMERSDRVGTVIARGSRVQRCAIAQKR